MHDCFGKPLRPFDRVRAATKEELEAHGHVGDTPEPLSPAERVVLTGLPTATACNVNLADAVSWPAFVGAPGGGGTAVFAFQGSVGYATAYKLVRLEE